MVIPSYAKETMDGSHNTPRGTQNNGNWKARPENYTNKQNQQPKESGEDQNPGQKPKKIWTGLTAAKLLIEPVTFDDYARVAADLQ